MKKQAIALVASGLLLASGMSFAQEDPNTEAGAPAAAAGTGSGAGAGATGTLGDYGGVALGVAAVGLAVAAASDSGGGSSGTTGTTGTTGTSGTN